MTNSTFEDEFNSALWMLVHGALAMQGDGEDEEQEAGIFAEAASSIVAALLAHSVTLALEFMSKTDVETMISRVVRDALAGEGRARLDA